VTPDDLAGDFDYVPRSGPMPSDPADSLQAWQMLSETLAKSPTLLTMPDSQGRVIDPIELFKEMCRTPLGIRNIDSYFRQLQPPPGMLGQPGIPGQAQVKVMPDEAVQQQRQAGNVIPMRGAA